MKQKVRKLIERNRNNRLSATVMGTRCAVCSLPEEKRQKVDAELMGGTSLAKLARTVGVNKSSICRHARNHLARKVKSELAKISTDVNLVDAPSDLQSVTVRAELPALYSKAKKLLREAENGENWQATKWFLSEARQLLELAGRANGEFLDQSAARQPHVHLSVVMPRSLEAVHPQASNGVIEVVATQVE